MDVMISLFQQLIISAFWLVDGRLLYFYTSMKYFFSFWKEGLPSLKQHVHLVCWEHLQIRLFLHCTNNHVIDEHQQ